jgi:hypothetical protein
VAGYVTRRAAVGRILISTDAAVLGALEIYAVRPAYRKSQEILASTIPVEQATSRQQI